jgi:hypothetical protein
MSINTVSLFKDLQINNTDFDSNSIQTIKNRQTVKNSELINNKNTDLLLKDNNITKYERDFFKNMFPDNSDQIENYVLFNRNGRIKTSAMPKGIIIDGKA